MADTDSLDLDMLDSEAAQYDGLDEAESLALIAELRGLRSQLAESQQETVEQLRVEIIAKRAEAAAFKTAAFVSEPSVDKLVSEIAADAVLRTWDEALSILAKLEGPS